MAINQKSILFLISDSLARYTEDFRLLNNVNPYRLELNGVAYSVHATEVHDSGEGRQDDDEWRVQLQATGKATQAARNASGDVVLFIGFFPDGRVFSAWEPPYVLSLSARGTGTIYVPLSHWEIALRDGAGFDSAAARKLERDTVKVSMPTDALGFYMENWRSLHSATSRAELLTAIDKASSIIADDRNAGTESLEVELGGERKIVTATRTSFARDRRFAPSVLEAYGFRCCVCSKQLGLIEAAHIIPHYHPDSTDAVRNGLALCIEHHRLYDSKLLMPTTGRQLFLNPDRVEHLQNIGQDSGLDAIRALAAQQYRVPDHAPSRPDDGFLERGIRIRLGTDA